MHPLNKNKYFGVDGITTSFWNGSAVVDGYIVKQPSSTHFTMTDDGITNHTLPLAQTTVIASDIASNHGYATILVYPPDSNATGGSFTAHYGVDAATVVSSGTHPWNVGDHLALPSGAGSLTVASLSSTAIATLTVGTAGNYTSLFSSPTTCTRAAGSGATLTANYAVDTVAHGTTLGSGGTGYSVGNVLTLATAGGATVTVDTVNGSGVVLTFHVSAPGTGVTVLGTTRTTTGGGGTGCTITPKWYLLSVTSSGGTGYNVNDTLIFNGITATTTPTAHISVATSHAATTVVVDTAGAGITVAATSITTSTTTATVTLTYNLLSVASSGGSGYNVNDILSFNGMVAGTFPTAHISTATSGAATASTVDTAGAGISVAATSITVDGIAEHVRQIFDSHLVTTEGNSYGWKKGAPVNGSAFVKKYSDYN